jgi:hypothetical protein
VRGYCLVLDDFCLLVDGGRCLKTTQMALLGLSCSESQKMGEKELAQGW